MKKTLYIILPILGIAYIYGTVSFFYWNFNAGQWSEAGRYFFLMLSFVATGLGTLVAYNINEE